MHAQPHAFPVAKAFLEAEFDVICEKPLTTALEEAAALVEVAERSRRLLGVTYTYCGSPIVNEPLAPSRVMYAGLDTWSPVEDEVIGGLGLHYAESAVLAETSAPVLDWLAERHIEHLAMHFDLDVLDPSVFRPLLFNKPGLLPDAFPGNATGRMPPDQVVRLLRDVARACDVVGLAVTEHLPWDTLAMHDMLRQLSLTSG